MEPIRLTISLSHQRLVIRDDGIYLFEQESSTKDRMRRILYEEVDRLWVRESFPGWRILLWFLAAVPVYGLKIHSTFDNIVATIGLTSISLVIIWTIFQRVAVFTFDLSRDGFRRSFKIFKTPAFIKNLEDTLCQQIRTAQLAVREKQDAPEVSALSFISESVEPADPNPMPSSLDVV